MQDTTPTFLEVGIVTQTADGLDVVAKVVISTKNISSFQHVEEDFFYMTFIHPVRYLRENGSDAYIGYSLVEVDGDDLGILKFMLKP